MKMYFKFSFVLGLICAASGLLLCVSWHIVGPRIADMKKQEELSALDNVMGDVLANQKLKFVEINKQGIRYWRAFDGSKLVGYAFPSSKQGYAGPIKVMAGIKPNGTILGLRVIQQTETPGLGTRCVQRRAKATLWSLLLKKVKGDIREKKPWFLAQFVGTNALTVKLTHKEEHNAVVAITGSTITSRAILDAVKDGAKEVLKVEGKSQ